MERRTIQGTNGTTIRREVVEHPGAVVILPILDDGRIVMIRNFRYGVERELLELPAGTRDEGAGCSCWDGLTVSPRRCLESCRSGSEYRIIFYIVLVPWLLSRLQQGRTWVACYRGERGLSR